jgi:hypothetical protein
VRDNEASAPCVGRSGITQSSSRITNTPAAGSGAGAGQFSHWPHPGSGASLSGISTTAARSPAVRAGDDDADVAVVAAVVAVVADATFCCSPVATGVARGGSPVTAALPAARGALNDRRLVGTDVSDLSALAGTRAGMTGATLRTRKCKNEHLPLEIKGERGKYCLPQTGEALLAIPRGFGRRHCGARHHRRSARRRLLH